ncbi:MAG TPA: hypothetical protein VLA56_16875 [Pseudomonadales bacterium]|nr:hypothetical protein [Pseudomonadales bacterium]
MTAAPAPGSDAARAFADGDFGRAAALYAQRAARDDAGPRDFYRLAISLRETGDADAALAALAAGLEAGLPAAPAAIERARIEARRGDDAATAAAITAATAAGATAIEVLEGDPAVRALRDRPAVAAALAAMRIRARPCAADPAFHDFDFWLGDWEVRAADGSLAGHNRVTAVEGGCRIDEAWTSSAGMTGRSINFLDPVSGQWEQLWHAAGGSFIRIRGGLDDEGAMVLEGHLHDVGAGTTQPFRGTWTLLADGRVRQFFETFSDEGGWQPWFEGFYARVGADAE